MLGDMRWCMCDFMCLISHNKAMHAEKPVAVRYFFPVIAAICVKRKQGKESHGYINYDRFSRIGIHLIPQF
jgi:hypothetical protein